MNVRSSPQTVHDYCIAWSRKEIRVNRAYQRSPRVWPPAARSYLIESIIKQFPIPKLSLHQNVDPKTKSPFKEIVDGQQRTMAIVEFFEKHYRLSPTLETEELRNCSFDQLGEDERQAFLNYSLDIDLFVATTPAEVREAFRRMNSYTIPLNEEEKRHAKWQGAFKWFINALGHDLSETLLAMGVFSEKQIIRMADTKLLTEIVHATLNGIQTTKGKQLNDLYREYDDAFPEKDSLGRALRGAIEEVAGWEVLHSGPLMKHYNFYAMTLALMHTRKPLAPLQVSFPLTTAKRVQDDLAVTNLSVLAEALESPEEHQEYEKYVGATEGRTNVKEQREIRFQWMCRALTQKRI